MPRAPENEHAALIAAEMQLSPSQVQAVLGLLDEKATVPFIARYRKEATGGLDEVQIRAIEERVQYLQELADRRATVLATIEKQGKLTPALQAAIAACATKTELEDLYLPFKPKRRTRGQMARERGLSPLSERIMAQPDRGDPLTDASAFVDPDKGVQDVTAALQGAKDILAEQVAEHPTLRKQAREVFHKRGVLTCKVVKKAVKEQGEPTKYEQYYDFAEPAAKIPSHRFLAIRRGEQEGILRASIDLEDDSDLLRQAERSMGMKPRSPYAQLLSDAVADGCHRLLFPAMESECNGDVKSRADEAAVHVFADNLRHLLLAAPLGGRAVLGIDPGFRTGCKCAAIDETGQLLEHVTIYPTSGERKAEEAAAILRALIQKHRPAAIAVGNGTAGRETEAFVREVLERHDLQGVWVVLVNEAGASVYSASEIARHEFPDLDLTVRGAVSIARRLQDPLAELVKIEPQAIGVGQYQHDVSQGQLARKLGEVVESCVNHVGVELNTASAPLLAHVSGLGPSLAERIIDHRAQAGPFASKNDLLQVKGLGARTFEQAAGFLRIRGGKHPLDASAVHPERYTLVERMARDLGTTVDALMGDAALVDRIDIKRYLDPGAGLGEPTLLDILSELKKPGRDPRDHFEPPQFRKDVQTLADLKEGMQLQGIVTNVTAFGAFVDVGVHQDGLVHVSQLADRFIRDPAEVVKVGDRLQVRVLSVDLQRKRIALSARSGAAERGEQPRDGGGRPHSSAGGKAQQRGHGPEKAHKGAEKARKFSNNPFAKLLKD